MAQAVLQGIVQTSLETEVPVLSAVLTPHHFHEHAVHEEFFKDHMRTKGKELAEACVSIIERLGRPPLVVPPRPVLSRGPSAAASTSSRR